MTSACDSFIIGIDGLNLRSGGAVRHVVELLEAIPSSSERVARVVLWASPELTSLVAPKPWLAVLSPCLGPSVLKRELWRLLRLPGVAKAEGCSVLFSPGGNPVFRFRPWVSMSQNLLPFEVVTGRPLARTRLIRLGLLRKIQRFTFRRADCVIFLSEHAHRTVRERVGGIRESQVVRFGVSDDFAPAVRASVPDDGDCFRLVYLSEVDYYKHQIEAIEAIRVLRQAGLNVSLDLVGGGRPEEVERIESELERVPGVTRFQVAPAEVAALLTNYHAGLFLSGCENSPNALIEMVAVGLPVVMSCQGSVVEIAEDAGVIVDQNDPRAVAAGIRLLIENLEMFQEAASRSSAVLRQRTWSDCSDETVRALRRAAAGPVG